MRASARRSHVRGATNSRTASRLAAQLPVPTGLRRPTAMVSHADAALVRAERCGWAVSSTRPCRWHSRLSASRNELMPTVWVLLCEPTCLRHATSWLGHSPHEHLETYAHVVPDRSEVDYRALIGRTLIQPFPMTPSDCQKWSQLVGALVVPSDSTTPDFGPPPATRSA